MSKPRLLDLFCGAGGATKGYQRAGFYVVGVDIKPQPRYCGDEFIEGDATVPGWQLIDFDAIHASPPCQAYTTMAQRWDNSSRPALIDDMQDYLRISGVPWVIENVLGSRRVLRSAIMLTGEMFGLRVHRPRLFETSWPMGQPVIPPRQKNPTAVYGKLDGRRLWTRADGTELRAPRDLEAAKRAMGIDWMEWDELRESIPPAYTEYVGRELLRVLEAAVADPETLHE